jgi:hypothetical protein
MHAAYLQFVDECVLVECTATQDAIDVPHDRNAEKGVDNWQGHPAGT